MSFLKNLFGSQQLDGNALVHSTEMKEYAQVDLLTRFDPARPLHDEAEQRRWSRVLPKPYPDTIALFQKQGWLEQTSGGACQVTPVALPFVTAYRQRLAQEKAAAMAQARAALASMMTSEALTIRRKYENRLPLGKADWTGPEPQMSYSAITRRIFFLDHWLLDGLAPETVAWVKQYAAEEHLWGTHWEPSLAEMPEPVRADLARTGADPTYRCLLEGLPVGALRGQPGDLAALQRRRPRPAHRAGRSRRRVHL